MAIHAVGAFDFMVVSRVGSKRQSTVARKVGVQILSIIAKNYNLKCNTNGTVRFIDLCRYSIIFNSFEYRVIAQ